MRPCAYPGCGGTVDDTGYCDTCGREDAPGPRAGSQPSPPLGAPDGAPPERPSEPPRAEPPRAEPPRAEPPRADGGGAARTHSAAGRSGVSGRLVSLPELPPEDPRSRVDPDPRPPSHGRPCGRKGCGGIIGGSHAGQPALLEGFCPSCGTRYSFKPKLRPGEPVGQYEVVGCLAHGGLGWVYLARDTNLDGLYVVLKGLINANDEVAAELAVRERRFLTAVHHPNIVRIFNFVTHPDPQTGEETGYIVMEYVGGQSLHGIAADRRLPLEQVIAYGLQILSAFEYLHDFTDTVSGRHGLLYCDMKPDNVIHTGRQVKLIDLGAVRWIGDADSPLVYTHGFQVSPEEIRQHGLTVRSDLHTVGHTLRELFRHGPGHAGAQDPGAESFQRLLARATGPFDGRFASAAEMAEQLRGVLREILSLRDGNPRPEPSAVFTPTAALLDAGLGAVPPLERWTGPAGRTIAVDPGPLDPGLPDPPAGAVRLPAPQVDPADPAAGFLAGSGAVNPGRLIDKLAALQGESAEARFLMCRAHLELAEADGAARCLAAAEEILGRAAPYDWRTAWHRGLLALAHGRVDGAEEEFDAVYTALPGEDAPKLALGFCAEHLGRPEQAERYYRAVWRRDRSQASAAFGLARIRLAAGDRTGAVRILDQVPQISRHFDAARIAAVRICSGRLPAGRTGTGLPASEDLGQAADRLADLYLDGGEPDGDARARLTTAVQETVLDRLRKAGGETVAPVAAPAPGRGAPILADPADEEHQRLLLEASLRRLARQAARVGDHDVLIDLANEIRPETLR